MNQPITITGNYNQTVHYFICQNNLPLIQDLWIQSHEPIEYTNVKVIVQSEPEFFQPWTTYLPKLEPQTPTHIQQIPLNLSTEFLSGLDRRMVGTITVLVMVQGQLKAKQVFPVTLLAYQEWGGMSVIPESITCFVLPAHETVTMLTEQAKQILKQWGGTGFYGYQSHQPSDVYYQMAAIYQVLQAKEFEYQTPQANFEQAGQMVQPPDKVLEKQLGNCFDLTLLYAGCLEALGLHPIIVWMQNHVFIGCWVRDMCFSSAVQDDYQLLRSKVGTDIYLVETTVCVTGDENYTFEEAVELGSRNLDAQKRFRYIVDVFQSRQLGIQPLPFRKQTPSGYVLEWSDQSNYSLQTQEVLDAFYGELEHIDRLATWSEQLLSQKVQGQFICLQEDCNHIPLEVQDCNRLATQLLSKTALHLISQQDNTTSVKKSPKPLVVLLDQDQMQQQLFLTHQTLLRTLEQTGSSNLVLTLGFLRWSEQKQSTLYTAPLLFFPVKLVRKQMQNCYQIRFYAEKPIANTVLEALLMQRFRLDISIYREQLFAQKKFDVNRYLEQIGQMIVKKRHWSVEGKAMLHFMPIDRLILWNDLQEQKNLMVDYPLLQNLISGKQIKPMEELPIEEKPLYSPTMMLPLPANQIQRNVIFQATQGNSFVINALAGTEKVETITNIIANLMYHGKTVLYISPNLESLEKIQSQLTTAHLNLFALSYYGDRANQAAMLFQLQKIIEFKQHSGDDFLVEFNNPSLLEQQWQELSVDYYKKQWFGFSLYEVLVELEHYRGAKEVISFTEQQIADLTMGRYSQWRSLIRQLTTAGRDCGGVCDHPLREFHIYETHVDLQKNLSAQLKQYLQNFTRFKIAFGNLSNALGIADIEDMAQIRGIVTLCELLGEVQPIPAKLLTAKDTLVIAPIISELCKKGKDRDFLETEILKVFEERVFRFDEKSAYQQWEKAQASWAMVKWVRKHKVWKLVREYALDPDRFRKDDVFLQLSALVEYRTIQELIQNKKLEEYFGSYWNQGRPDWDEIQDVYQQALEVRQSVEGIYLDHHHKKQMLEHLSPLLQQGSNVFRTMVQAFRAMEQSQTQLGMLTGIDLGIFSQAGQTLLQIQQMAERWSTHLEQLNRWIAYCACRKQLVEYDLLQVLEVYEKGFPDDELLQAFHWGFFSACKDFMEKQYPQAFLLKGEQLIQQIEQLKQLQKQFEGYSRQQIVLKLSTGISAIPEFSQFQQDLEESKASRETFIQYAAYLQRLWPCMLMTPVSAVQSLAVEYPKFDCVILDDANQLEITRGINMLMRAKQAIVIGDCIQTTKWENTSAVEDCNIKQKPEYSVLEECMSISVPQYQLSVGCCLQQEDIMAFSNQYYYQNALLTFPAFEKEKMSINYLFLKGYYDGNGKNTVEARTIVREIVNLLKQPEEQPISIGVVTVTEEQRDWILQLLNENFQKDVMLELADKRLSNPISVDSLDSLRPNEFDYVFFSVVYGTDQMGREALYFGTLSKKDGWKKLNLALAKARRAWKIVSILHPKQILLSRYHARGVADLKALLEFCQAYQNEIPPYVAPIQVNAAIEIVADRIKQLGYSVKTNVGLHRQRVDIAIMHPEKTDCYLLGILLDNQDFETMQSAADGMLLKASILERLGWRLHFLWMIDWWNDSQAELEKIKQWIALALEEETQPKPYQKAVTAIRRWDEWEEMKEEPEEFNQPLSSKEMIAEAVKLVSKSAPLPKRKPTLYRQPLRPAYRQGNRIQQPERLVEVEDVEIQPTKKEKQTIHQTDIKELISQLATGKTGKKVTTTSKKQSSDQKSKTKKIKVVAYQAYQQSSTVTGADAFCDSEYNEALLQQIEEIIKLEAPISQTLLNKRLLSSWKITRSGARLTRRLEELYQMGSWNQTQEDTNAFYWRSPTEAGSFALVRTAQNTKDRREWNDISQIEIRNAIDYLIISKKMIEEEEIIKEACKLFGYARPNEQHKAQIEQVIKQQIKEKHWKRSRKKIEIID